MKSFVHSIKKFIQNIANIIRWIPVIFRDKDWDFQYIYDILAFKMQNMLKYYNKSTILCDEENQEIIGGLKRCLYLLDKLTNNGYEDEAYDYYYKKYPEYPENYFKQIQIERNGKMVWKLLDNRTDEMKADFRECSARAMQLESLYRTELFQLICNKINFWWD